MSIKSVPNDGVPLLYFLDNSSIYVLSSEIKSLWPMGLWRLVLSLYMCIMSLYSILAQIQDTLNQLLFTSEKISRVSREPYRHEYFSSQTRFFMQFPKNEGGSIAKISHR
jgi:hypothetical protein